MPRAVFINGYPASGKSTLARALREQNIAAPVICKDDIKETFYEKFGMNNDDHGKELNQVTLQLIFSSLEEHARANVPVVIEANFKPSFDQKIVQSIVEKYNIEMLQIMLTCSAEELLRRDTARRASGNRPAGHTGLRAENIKDQMEVVGHFDLPRNKAVTFDTETSGREDFEKLVRTIVAFCGSR